MKYNPNGFPTLKYLEDNTHEHIEGIISEVGDFQFPDDFYIVDITDRVAIPNKFPLKLDISTDDYNSKEYDAIAELRSVYVEDGKKFARYWIEITKEL